MAVTREGAIKIAAIKANISVAEYRRLRSRNLKKCTACKTWAPSRAYVRDGTRADRRGYICLKCRLLKRTAPGPSKPERAKQRTLGKAWCGGCEAWLPIEKIHGGKCQPCHNAYARNRYATNVTFREMRKENSRQQKRRR